MSPFDIDHIGFSGTRLGMSERQSISVLRLLTNRRIMVRENWFHHGNCRGADAQACEMARKLGFKIYRHPALDKTYDASCPYDETDPEYSYHGRNQRIVARTCGLIAAPHRSESSGGGTWWTINCARRMKKPRIIVFRDGSTMEETGG